MMMVMTTTMITMTTGLSISICSSSTASQTQYHLSSQYYDICIRRARSYCSICYSPQIYSATAVSSYGLGAGSVAAIQTNAIDSNCPGTTTLSTTAASNNGDQIPQCLSVQIIGLTHVHIFQSL